MTKETKEVDKETRRANLSKEKKEVDTVTRRANLSFLQLIFPVFMLVLIPSEINGNVIYGLILKILIFGYQYFITQQFVKSMYN